MTPTVSARAEPFINLVALLNMLDMLDMLLATFVAHAGYAGCVVGYGPASGAPSLQGMPDGVFDPKPARWGRRVVVVHVDMRACISACVRCRIGWRQFRDSTYLIYIPNWTPLRPRARWSVSSMPLALSVNGGNARWSMFILLPPKRDGLGGLVSASVRANQPTSQPARPNWMHNCQMSLGPANTARRVAVARRIGRLSSYAGYAGCAGCAGYIVSSKSLAKQMAEDARK